MAPNFCTFLTQSIRKSWYVLKKKCKSCYMHFSLQAVLKFSAAVIHISNMYFRDETEASIVTCCLGDGQIMAFSVENFWRK